MELEQFDELTRRLSTAGSSRRHAFRALGSVLLGGALGGVAAQLGLVEGAGAKSKGKPRKANPKRKPQAERKGNGQLQAEGKRKGKRRHKKPKAPVECDEVTIPLCGPCEEPVCAAGDWVCRSNGEQDCGNGVCAKPGQCCPDKFRCDDGTCVDPLDECCPDQTDCGGGVCVDEEECCPGKKKCPGYTECFAQDDCCPNALPPLCAACDKVVCEDGSLVCRPKSAVCSYPENEKVCCNGDLVCRGDWDLPERCATYTPERTYNPANCRCQCPPDTNDSLGLCCPWDYPTASPAGDGSCFRWEDCGGYECARTVCARGFSRDRRNLCVRTT